MTIKEVDLFAVGTRRENGTITPHVIIRLVADDGTVGAGEMSDLGHSPEAVRYHPGLRTSRRQVDGDASVRALR